MSTTFHQFASLPKELRLQIWEASMEPREVPYYFMPNNAPSLLQVCHESRTHILQFYSILSRSPTTIYLNPDIDWLRLGESFHLNCRPEILRVRNLIIEGIHFLGHYNFWVNPWGYLARFPYLENVTLVHYGDYPEDEPEPDRWQEVIEVFRWAYYTCSPQNFRVTCRNPDLPQEFEITPENYIRLDRERLVELLKKEGGYPFASVGVTLKEDILKGDIGYKGSVWFWRHTAECCCEERDSYDPPSWAKAQLQPLFATCLRTENLDVVFTEGNTQIIKIVDHTL